MNGGAMSQPPPLAVALERWEGVVIEWGLDPDERSGLLGSCGNGPVGSIETYRSQDAEARILLLVDLDAILRRVLVDPTRIRMWLRTPNVNLCRACPIEVMSSSTEWTRWIIRQLGTIA